ncbi:MAG: hypothetical protein VW268_02845 [Rhodospirillaceae bacterium]
MSHDIKGQGGSFGYGLMSEIGSILCRRIENIDTLAEGDMAPLRQCLDAMTQVIENRLDGDGGDYGLAIMAVLAPMMDRLPEGRR